MANEKRLVDAEAIARKLKNANCVECNVVRKIQCSACWVEDVLELLDGDSVDAVSRGVVDQIRWERDVAIKQLEEHGIPFCGIAPDVVKVVRCKDCRRCGVYTSGNLYCTHPNGLADPKPDDFCSYGERREGE